MKTLKTIAIAALVAASLASCASGPKVKVDVPGPSKGLTDTVSYLIGVNFGYFIKANGFGEAINYSTVKEGMMDFINSDGDVNSPDFGDNFRVNPELMNEMFNEYIEKVMAHEGAVNAKLGENFLAKKALEDGVVTCESGLLYKVIEPGNDTHPTADDKVCVNYKGTLIDGTEFDSYNAPDGLELSLANVIAGWTEGVQKIGEGGKMELYIPADLAYGQRNMGNIKPNSTLVFEIELVKVVAAEVAE